MRKLFILFLVCVSTQLIAQNSYKVTMNGIAEFKVGMKKNEVEKLLNQTFALKNLLSKDDWSRDSIPVHYKDLDLTLILDKQYIDENKYDIILWGIVSSSMLIKTPSGITIGDDKLKSITTYDGYTIHIAPDYENDYTVKSKTRSTIWLFADDSGNQIVFHLENNNIYSIGVSYVEEYD